MVLSHDEKRHIAGRARTLQERLTNPPVNKDNFDQSSEWIDEWKRQVADGSEELFKRRLSIEGISPEECSNAIASDEWPDEKPLPEWVHRISDLLEFTSQNETSSELYFENQDIPFIHVLTHIVSYARSQLTVSLDLLTQSAKSDIHQLLLEKLSKHCAHPLFIELKTFIAKYEVDLAWNSESASQEGSQEYYTRFIQEMVNGGVKDFFIEYSFLARIIDTIICNWIEQIEEFYQRLSSDLEELRMLCADNSLEEVSSIRACGDAHHGGRTVLKVKFSNGCGLVYKPRPLRGETIFYKVVEKIRLLENFGSFVPRMKNMGEYGWMEWVASRECNSHKEVEQYYRNCGSILAVMYALKFSDGHLENIIAAGNLPSVIDLETIAQPRLNKDKMSGGDDSIGRRDIIYNSVLLSGTVPMYHRGSMLDDTAGFGTNEASFNCEFAEYIRPNTDTMEMVFKEKKIIRGDNLPKLNGQVVDPTEHVSSITAGFSHAYSIINNLSCKIKNIVQNHKTDKPCFRYVYRPTWIYSSIIECLTIPSFLRTGIKFGCKLEALAKPMLKGGILDCSSTYEVYKAERKALMNLSIPRFTFNISHNGLCEGDDEIADVFQTKPIDEVCNQLDSLSSEDCNEQVEFIEWGFSKNPDTHVKEVVKKPYNPIGMSGDDYENIERAAFNSAAEIFNRIKFSASSPSVGHKTWTLRKIGPNGGIDIHSIPDGLYAGRTGIGVFVAALYKLSKEKHYKDFTEKVIAPVTNAISEEDLSIESVIGGGTGSGSIIYGYTTISSLLGENEYLDYASKLVQRLSKKSIQEEDQLDVIDGVSGLLLALINYYRDTGDRTALQKAIMAGDSILKKSSSNLKGSNGNKTQQSHLLTGFAHGAAGVAYSLQLLGQVSDESKYTIAAEELIQFENDYYSPQKQNWPDLRSDSSNWKYGWCYGRTGIGLARLGMYKVNSSDTVLRDIQRSLNSIDWDSVMNRDHVCCGNFGRIEFLLKAGEELDVNIYREQALELAFQTIQRAKQTDSYNTRWQNQYWYNPTFFRGEAGIGYSLLRIVDPSLPSILLWE